MRESIGTTSVFKIMLAFTFLFVAFIAIAINYNKAYRVKNQSISIIERYEGMREDTIMLLNQYLKNSGYYDKGKCPTDIIDKNGNKITLYGSSNLDTTELSEVVNSKEYYYCVYEECTNGTSCKIGGNNRIKYSVRFFSKFSIPLLGDLSTFKITGQTKSIKLYDEAQKLR